MDIYLQSLTIFLVLTIIYFVALKPKLSIEQLPTFEDTGEITPESTKCFNEYKSSIFPKLALYLLAVCLVQFILNTAYLNGKCGGTSKDNIGISALYTFLPWTIIFGSMIAILIIFPGFKSAFSDVIGYFAISGSAKDIFNDILVNNEIQGKIAEDDPNKDALENAAEALTKMVGDKSILVNKMTPDNFADFWNTMKPLMKDEIKTNNDVFMDYKKQLLDLVVLKENIGEGLWYLYTAMLIASIVYFNLANVGCKQSVAQIKASHDEYIKEQEAVNQKMALNNSVQVSMS